MSIGLPKPRDPGEYFSAILERESLRSFIDIRYNPLSLLLTRGCST